MRFNLTYIITNALCVFAFVFATSLWGQSTLFHFDRPYYQPGQIIYYSCSIDGITEAEVTLHMSLRSAKGVEESHFLKLDSGAGAGYFQLPFDGEGGTYILESNLFDLDNGSPILVSQIPLVVVGELDERQEVLSFVTSDSCPENPDIKIELPGEVGNREGISCHIKIDGGKEGDLVSVAVRDAFLFPNGQTTFVFGRSPEFGRLDNSIPIVADRILEHAKYEGSNLIFASIPEELTFRFGQLSQEERFRIVFPPFYGKKEITFIDNASVHSQFDRLDIYGHDQSIPVTSRESKVIVKDLPTNKLRKKIYELNGQLEETVVPLQLPEVSPSVSPDYPIDVQDFAIRGRLVDLLKELFTPFLFRKKNDGSYYLKVVYEVLGLKEYYEDEAVFFINGIGTRDFDYVANLPLQDIKTVDIYAELKTLRSLKLVDIGGVGIIEMMDPLFVIPEDKRLASIEIQGLQIPIDFPISADPKSSTPQLKSLLYWHPNLRLDAKGECVFEISTSDDVSVFDLEVVHHPTSTTSHAKLPITYKQRAKD